MKYEKPEIIETDDPHADHKETHPAYAVVQISRTSGHAQLFDSEFNHQHFITLRIAPADVTRNLSNNWIYQKNTPYIEVEMSEAQFATAITSINAGSGTPCTLKYRDSERVPGIERDPNLADNKFKDEMQKTFSEAIESTEELESLIDSGKMTAKLKKSLQWQIEKIRRACGGSSAQFVADQYSEHMERVKEKGKAELHAHALRIGLTEDPLAIDRHDRESLTND